VHRPAKVYAGSEVVTTKTLSRDLIAEQLQIRYDHAVAKVAESKKRYDRAVRERIAVHEAIMKFKGRS
jgi:hypothetical protein